jgi:hypothetical protein
VGEGGEAQLERWERWERRNSRGGRGGRGATREVGEVGEAQLERWERWERRNSRGGRGGRGATREVGEGGEATRTESAVAVTAARGSASGFCSCMGKELASFTTLYRAAASFSASSASSKLGNRFAYSAGSA